MFEHYKIKEEEVLILYLNYNYEFGLFDTIQERSKKLMSLINEYIQKNKIKFHGKKIMLVANGILITSLLVSSTNLTKETQEQFESNVEIEDSKELVFHNPNTSTQSTTPSLTPPKFPPIIEEPQTNPYETNIGKKITVIRSNGTIINLTLEDYIIGVVAGEMPASFHIEALKSQALASRTYALKKINDNKTLTDTIQDQVYVDIEQMRNLWQEDFDYYYNKIKTAVLETQGKTIQYQNNLIDAVYFSTSNGFTEDSIYAWNNAFSYLVSVESPWDVNTKEDSKLTTKSLETVSQKLGIPITNETPITILGRNSSNRVVTIQ